jgi:phenylacetate-CoA ligase
LIRENQASLISRGIKKEFLFEDRTGGSSGVPLSFYRDKQCLQKRRAQELFFDHWMGYEIGDKIGLFVAAKHMPPGMKGFKRRFRNETSDRFLAFDPSNIDDAYLEDFLGKFRKYKPDFIKCFPNSLYIFSNYIKKKGMTIFW